jgi:HEAT repeat protein
LLGFFFIWRGLLLGLGWPHISVVRRIMPQQHPEQSFYDSLVQQKDIKGLLLSSQYGLRADDDEHILLAVNACVAIGAAAIPHLVEALDYFAMDARLAAAQQLLGPDHLFAFPSRNFSGIDYLRNPAGAWKVDREIQQRLKGLDSNRNPCFPPALALSRLGKSSMAPLIQYLQDDRDWLSREVAAWALGEVGDTTAIPTLKRLIRFLRWGRVSAAARRAIRMIEGRHGQ